MATITLPAGTEKVRLHDSPDSPNGAAHFDGVAQWLATALLPPKTHSTDGDALDYFLTCEQIQTALMDKVDSGEFGLFVPPLPLPVFKPTAAQQQNALMTIADFQAFAASCGVGVVTAPAQSPATPAPVVAASDGPAATVDRGWVMKRAALIAKHGIQWSTIDRDFQDASENGLSKAAKAPGHGDWFESSSLNWASNGAS